MASVERVGGATKKTARRGRDRAAEVKMCDEDNRPSSVKRMDIDRHGRAQAMEVVLAGEGFAQNKVVRRAAETP